MQVFYTVRAGETLSLIAARWGLPVSSIIAANKLAPPYTIYSGQQLSIPPGVSQTRVKPGDTLYHIAQSYGVPIEVIIQANQIKPPYTIQVDKILKVPPGVPYYVVQKGDNLYSIAERFQVVTSNQARPDLIMVANGLKTSVIIPGMRLVVPYAPPGDGGWIAYTSQIGGNYDISLYHLTAGIQFRLTEGLAADYSIPYWSPDSRQIAFVGNQGIIYIIDIETRKTAEIDQIQPYTLLSWSPDAQSLTYARDKDIVIYNTSIHSSKTIPEPGASDVGWFPSGSELIFAAPDANGISQLFRMDIEGKNKKQITQNTDGPLHHVRLSPDGRFVFYTTPGASVSMIYTVHIETAKTIPLEGGPLGKNYNPVWSPDSQTIAYSATFYPGAGYFNYIETDLAVGKQQKIWAISNCFSTPVSWSTSGQKIAYLSNCTDDENPSEIWVVDLHRPAPTLIVKGEHITAINWSPNAKVPTPQAIYQNAEYRISFSYPVYWKKENDQRYVGSDGFFQVAAIAGSENIRNVCHSEAFHILKPYGNHPQIIRTIIQDQEACYIYPSADQPKEMKQQAALIVRYPKAIDIQGKTYQYLILWADKPHIYSMGRSLSFLL